ncbi:gem-associated protein 2 [Leguminivora glycinivorella]|uniref:gem-associated protein 2 n=1 Tax=Leguminivora glycinivorella TaxID=1035111 RepID=UPI00200E380A|nr:gem-associated protein 2 [Leguminivora glycinivorella]
MGTENSSIIYKANEKKKNVHDDLITKCFEISSDVEMKEIPITGAEYLLKVMTERANVAAVTVCDKDITQFAKNQSLFVKEPPGAKVAPDKLRTTIEWQKIQMSDFAEVRTSMAKIKNNLLEKGIGKKRVKPIVIHDQSLEGWKIFFQEHDSTVTCMLGFTPEQLHTGLEMLTEILKEVPPGDTIEHKTGQWIYAFLACLRHPPLSETVSLLRDLARTCAEIRSNIDQEEEDAYMKAAPTNLFICIVARYFEQCDLAD